jgi:hypothetical protein
MKHFFTILCCIAILNTAFAQAKPAPPPLPADLQALQTAYSALSKYEMDVEYIVYSNASASKPVQTEQTKVQRNGTSAHTRISTLETLITPQYALRLDHNHKTIVLSKAIAQNMEETMKVNWQMFFKLATSYTPIPSKDKTTIAYKVGIGGGAVETMEMYIDAETHLMKSCVLYYRESHTFDKSRGKNKPEQPKLVMNYKKINTNPTFTESTFSTDKFVVKKGNTWQLAPAYKNWTLKVSIN